ncbi:tape measure protein [Comamonas antarctica]|uniref:tape measure protein n=1 Tax=Comamonas antarctica TaxID=2743470 RepID=UPI0028E70CA5|nr:tape measure protein [Comamonas antarctica]
MATTSRDAKLTLSVDTLGQENISALEKGLRQLAATGDSSAAEFEQLADEIARLGDQSDALQTVRALAAGTETLQAKQEAAATTVQQLSTRLEELRAATQQAKEAQDAARAALTAGEKANVDATGALRTLKAEYDATQRNTQAYRTELQRLVSEQNSAKAALVDLREANRQANAEVIQAEAAQRKAETATRNATKQYETATKALADQAQAFKEATSAAEKLGVDTAALGTAEGAMLATFSRATQVIEDQAAAARALAAEQKELAEAADFLKQADTASYIQWWTNAMRDGDAAAAALAEEQKRLAAAMNAAKWQEEAYAIVEATHAQQAMLAKSRELDEQLRQFAANDAFAKKAAEAQAMVRAADYVQFWTQALDAAEAKEQELIATTKRLDDAFKTIDVRPIEQVRLEIADTNAAMATLAASGRLTGGALEAAMVQSKAKVAELEREVRSLNGTLTMTDKASMLLKNSLGQIAAGNLIADGVGYLVNKVKELGAAFIETLFAQERLSRGLMAIYKDSTLVTSQMNFLRAAAQASGVAVGNLGPSFLKFAAATHAANIPLDVTNQLFLAVTRAAGTLGLNGEQVSGMLEALSQMASKGTVSLEELRQQLGDRLPGALSLVAKGLGITEAQLIKLVESGQLAARDLFPALTKSLQTMQGEVKGLNVTWQNLKTMFSSVAQDLGDAGWTQILTAALQGLGLVLGAVTLTLQSFWEGLRMVGVAAVAMGDVLRGEPARALAFFNEEAEKTNKRLADQVLRMRALVDPSGEAAQELTRAAQAQQQLALETDKTSTALEEQSKASATVSASINFLAEATKLLGNEQMDLAAKIVRLNVMASERLAVLEKESVAAGKLAKATEVQGSALVTLTQLRGSEIESLKAQLTAAENNAQAAANEAVAQRSVTEVLEQQRAALVELAKQEATGLAGRKAELEAIDKKLVSSRAETAQTDAAAASAREEVNVRKLAVQTLQDNSARLAEFRAASVAAEAAVIAYRHAIDDGSGSQAELTRLQQQAALAMGLYRDAIADATAKTQALASVEQARINLQTTTLGVQQQAYEQLAAAARANNQLALATSYEVEAKRTQIKITELVAQAKVKEAEALIAAAKAEVAAAEANGTLTDAKKLEAEARILNAQAKMEEAKASEIAVRGLQQEIDNLHRYGSAQGAANGALNANTSAVNANMSAREQSIVLREKELELAEREQKLADKAREGSATMVNELGTRTGIVNFLKQAGVTDDAAARRIANEFADANGNILYSNNPGQIKYGGRLGTLSDAVMKAAEQYTFSEKNMKASSTTTGTTDTSTATTKATSSTKTVTINIGGQSRNVNVASQADSDALVAVLRQLEAQGATAT